MITSNEYQARLAHEYLASFGGIPALRPLDLTQFGAFAPVDVPNQFTEASESTPDGATVRPGAK